MTRAEEIDIALCEKVKQKTKWAITTLHGAQIYVSPKLVSASWLDFSYNEKASAKLREVLRELNCDQLYDLLRATYSLIIEVPVRGLGEKKMEEVRKYFKDKYGRKE